MKIALYLIGLCTFALQLHAGEGIVVVYETAIFGRPDPTAPVVERKRRGDRLYIHNKHFKDNTAKRFSQQTELYGLESDAFPTESSSAERNFYLTLDINGREAYVLRRHIQLQYNDTRELNSAYHPQIEDHTFFGQPEPLPDDYPFILKQRSYRGALTFGFTTSNQESYPDPRPYEAKSTLAPLEISAFLNKGALTPSLPGLFFGGILLYTYRHTQLTLCQNCDTTAPTQITSREDYVRLGFGPMLSYDFFHLSRNRLNLFGAPLLYLIDQANLHRLGGSELPETNTYRAITYAIRVGVLYTFFQALGELDLLAGTAIQLAPSTELASQGAPNSSLLWPSGNLPLTRSEEANLSLFIGLQREI